MPTRDLVSGLNGGGGGTGRYESSMVKADVSEAH